MEGPVRSGGVIVLVAALLWLLYLLPSWRGRAQFHAAERNAVRLNQALRPDRRGEFGELFFIEMLARLELAGLDAIHRQRAQIVATDLGRDFFAAAEQYIEIARAESAPFCRCHVEFRIRKTALV